MNYRQGREELRNLLDEEEFWSRAKAGEYNSASIRASRCTSGSEVVILYPGKKAEYRFGNMDFRVDFRDKAGGVDTPLSHENIILDLYNKVVRNEVDHSDLFNLIKAVAKEGLLGRNDLPAGIRAYEPGKPPDPDTIALADNVHSGREHPVNRIAQSHNHEGNQIDLDTEELAKCMFWILLQEEENYPLGTVTRGGAELQGRKMAVSRYVEAVWCAGNDRSKLPQVINRALAHARSHPRMARVDYSFIEGLR